ncbi:DegT/DnrJ/EryC1/StrS family aminotransferase [Streptococcus thermophilus]|uniref:DegT/DnrJ/EryC1/StrS family aminotransferase n=1 Tax=Streptococcus thermophilus TaxID=1308 RepID=UPI0003F0513A|nr:aminotransferase class I/II-fold pyridoxal phosphate-dependent enzyme [Streptococcus thermophilus]EWM55869.1 aminotransferase DegT [Streptococcus thermophilus TH985]
MAFDFSKKVVPFENKVWLASPTMHGEELKFMKEAYDTNWMTTAGSNINALEEQIKDYTKSENVVALSSGTSALHLAMKLAGIKKGDFVFCSNVTFSATVNPVIYEGGIPIFIDSEYETWNMDPKALEKAFELYPNVKVVVLVHLYGVPAKIDEIKSICDKHGAILIEDAAESLGATYKHQQTGTFGHYSVISFNGNKIITGSSGGALLTPELDAANKVRKWSTQAREQASWYQHEEIGYNYRMSNVIAGVARGQMPYLDEHIKQKKAIYDRYRDGLKDLPIQMNPFDKNNSVPNYWLSCMTILPEAMAKQVRSDSDVLYTSERGRSTPSEILDALNSINAESRPIWKPMHLQPIFRMNPFITKNGDGRAQTNAYINSNFSIVSTDIFERGLCLPSDNKMTVEEQDTIINTIRACFE